MLQFCLWSVRVSGSRSLSTVERQPVTHRESGPVDSSRSTGRCGAGGETQGSRVQRRSQQTADGKTALSEGNRSC